MEIAKFVVVAAIAYLLGNIQTGLLIGRLTNNVDLRQHGSGSSGATNALRVLGRKSALFTLLGDALKGIIATLVGMAIAGWHGGLVAALFVIIGHIWPVFYGFHGGKGVAASIGSLAVVMPLQALLMVVIGVAVLLWSKMVSLASITGAFVFMIAGSITGIVNQDWLQVAVSLLMGIIVIFAHRTNIKRLKNGTENKISAKMIKSKK